jgi:hypothetical protein
MKAAFLAFIRRHLVDLKPTLEADDFISEQSRIEVARRAAEIRRGNLYLPHDTIPHGSFIPFGATEAKPVRTSLPGKIRVSLRMGEFPRAFVRHNGCTRCFMLLDFGTHWELGQEHGRNVHYRATP